MSLKLVVFLVFAVYAGFVLLPLLGFIVSELHELGLSLLSGKWFAKHFHQDVMGQYNIADRR